jgi:hypothetical protein
MRSNDGPSAAACDQHPGREGKSYLTSMLSLRQLQGSRVAGETTMTVQAQFVPRGYDVFAGLDVDKKSTAVSFTDHQQLKQALRLPYSAELLLRYVRKHCPELETIENSAPKTLRVSHSSHSHYCY